MHTHTYLHTCNANDAQIKLRHRCSLSHSYTKHHCADSTISWNITVYYAGR